MKKVCLIIVFLFNSFFAYSQQRTCGTMGLLDEIKQNDPKVNMRMNLENYEIQKWIQNNSNSSKSIITIPVVVHVIYNTSSQNISDAQIFSQMDILNEDFRKLNSDASSVPSAFSSFASDCEIEFCLAVRDPSGNVTTGITRTQTSVSSFSGYTSMKYSSTGGVNAWNTNDYLNIWVCNLASGLLGFATFPGGNSSTDGVVCDYAYFGDIGTATYPYNLGRTATHEVGHWLNLYHIWGDSYCGNDYVSDTPKHEESNYGCPSFPHASSCSGTGSTGEMFMNYMDYTNDACMFMFTTGQKNRMRATLNGSRSSLLSSLGCQVVYPPITLSAVTTDVSCNSANDGSINLSVSGGTSPFTYSWSNGATTQDISNLSGGYYNVTVTDAAGQTASSSLYISEPSAISVNYSIVSTSAPGVSDGSVAVNVSGGVSPYSYSWSGPNGYTATTQDIQNVLAGTYTYYVIDANSCYEMFTIIVPEGQLTPLVVTENITTINCYGDHNGAINLTVNGGTPPYVYSWSNGATTQNISSLSAGIYTVTVTDAAAQIFTSSYILTEPAALTATYSVTNVTTPGGNDGAIDLTPSGGVMPYAFYWSTSPTQTTEDIFNLTVGTYTVWIVDANNCYIGIDIDVIEDIGNQSCTGVPITGLATTGVIHDRATFLFDNPNTYDATGAMICRTDQIRIKYRVVGTSSWSQKNLASPTGYDATGFCNTTYNTSKKVFGLIPSSTYEWEAKVWYCDGQTTGWVVGPQFTTLGECPNVGNLAVTTPTTTKATFTWDDSNGAYEFVRLKARINAIANPTAADWFNIGGNGVQYGTFTKNKNGLVPGETYRGQARTWCDPNGGPYRSASWSPLIWWTMPGNAKISSNIAERKLLRVTDLLGRELNPDGIIDNTTLLYIYSDGKVEKKIIIE